MYIYCSCIAVISGVENGSDDPDNLGHLGHFFAWRVSGSDPQTKFIWM